MTCNDILHQLDAYVDGETSPEWTRLIEDHLPGCPVCQTRVDELRALSRIVRSGLSSERAPSDLWSRIDAELPPTVGPTSARREAGWWRRTARPLALAASVALLLGIGSAVSFWQWRADYSVIAAPVQDFTTYRLSGRALDVESRDPIEVEGWFEARLAFELPRVKARIAGFDLVGGRLCWFLDRRISALAYERGDDVISVYVMADHDLALPEATFEPRLAMSRSVHQVDSVNNMIWHRDGLIYTIVSDLEKDDLSIFLAALARSERRNAAAATNSTKQQPTTMGAST